MSVAITNPLRDQAMLVTSVEFEGQLPELRYFYHGVYGSISRVGDVYEHARDNQMLTIPIGSCFLLPGQSASWQRPMRVLKGGYLARVTWREIPIERVNGSVWFEAYPKDPRTVGKGAVYEALAVQKQSLYRGLCAAGTSMRYVVVEGDLPSYSAEVHAACAIREIQTVRDDDQVPRGFPEGSVAYPVKSVAASVVVTADKVFFGKINPATGEYETFATPDLTPIEADFLYLRSRDTKSVVPCILPADEFRDLIEVQRPAQGMYLNPGITPVPIDVFRKVLARAEERQLHIRLERIDPNGLGQSHVLIARKVAAQSGK